MWICRKWKKTSVINLDLKRLSETFLSISQTRQDNDDVRGKRKFRSSQHFIPVPTSEVCDKKKHHDSFMLIGLYSAFAWLHHMFLIQVHFGPLLTCCLKSLFL